MNIDKLLDIALEHSSAEQTEASISIGRSALTRFANSTIHQNMLFEDGVLRVRAVFGKKVASGTTNRLDEAGVRELVANVVEMARLQDENKDFVSLPKPVVAVQSVNGYYDSTAQSTPEQRADAVRALVSESDKIGGTAAGAYTVQATEQAVKSTLGIDSSSRGTYAKLLTVVTGPDGGFGYAAATSGDASKIDGLAIGAEASERARDSRNPSGIEPGEYECILMPYAAADMINMLVWMGFGAMEYQEGQSWVCGKLGTKVVSESVSVWDDGLDARTIVTPFDGEGVAKQHVDLIKDGVANALLYDSYTAHREGKQSTGHAPWGRAGNLIVAPGEASVEDMIASTKRGVLVTRFHYTNVAHQMSASFTGMTRDGTFLIEDGMITKPVKNLRVTQSITEALSDTQMIGRETKLEDGVLAPALKLGKFRFSSATEF
jgi:PmbA protein